MPRKSNVPTPVSRKVRKPNHEQLAQLRLRGMAAALDAELDRGEREGAAPAEVISRLLAAEVAQRREKSLAYRLAQAKLPWNWTLESFPFDRQPGVDRGQIRALAGLDLLRRNENTLLIGPPGTGKTGIALALLREASVNGHAGRFITRMSCSTNCMHRLPIAPRRNS